MSKSNRLSLPAIFAVALIAVAVMAIIASLTLRKPVIVERSPIETHRPNLEIMTIAHRGALKFAPENTLPAIEKAIELGFDYVEMDIKYTGDDIPIVIHDQWVDRTTDGVGDIGEMTLEQIKALDAGSWFGPAFAGTKIPTLEEALQTAQGKICVFWDTKGFPRESVIDLFKKYGFDRECLLISFGGLGMGGTNDAPDRIVKLLPTAPLVPVVRTIEEITEILAEYPNIRGIWIPIGRVTPELVDFAHAQGLLVGSTTLAQRDHHHNYRKLIDNGVDIFMLDHIDIFQNYLKTGDMETPTPDLLRPYAEIVNNRQSDDE